MDKGTKKIIVFTLAGLAIFGVGAFVYVQLKGRGQGQLPPNQNLQPRLISAPASDSMEQSAKLSSNQTDTGPRPLVNVVRTK